VYRNKVRLALPQVLQIDASEWPILPFCLSSPLFSFLFPPSSMGLDFVVLGFELTFW
jgi:hypothetical protein